MELMSAVEIKLLYVMRYSVIVLLAAVAVAQFSMPDIAQIGDKIKNEVVNVEQKIEHLTKEEIQAAEKKLNEGLDILKGGDNHPEPVKQEEVKAEEAQVLPAILVEGAPVVLSLPAETKPVEHVASVESAPAVPVQEPVPVISDNLEPQPKEPKEPGHRQKGHKKGPHRESRSEEESSDDIQERDRPEHRGRKDHEEKRMKNKEKKHEYTPEELQKKRAEREQRIKEKEERRKAYEKKRRAERDSDSESESDNQERFNRHQRGGEERKHKDRGQHPKKNDIPDISDFDKLQVMTKMARKP